jgi:mono/diheme cytochrome c family protein
MPEIPDFTRISWQKEQDNARLLANILEGKGTEMPRWEGKISKTQARSLVEHVRAFAPSFHRPPQKSQGTSPTDRFEERYRGLEQQRDELKKEFRELSEPATGSTSRADLFRRHCVRCHGSDGKGSNTRKRMPEIPDFTQVSWQKEREDARLLASILEGKGTEMPRWEGKISKAQARSLVRHVRAFARPPHQHEPDARMKQK